MYNKDNSYFTDVHLETMRDIARNILVYSGWHIKNDGDKVVYDKKHEDIFICEAKNEIIAEYIMTFSPINTYKIVNELLMLRSGCRHIETSTLDASNKDVENNHDKDVITSPSHYSRWKIQPLDFISQNQLDFLRGNIIKYIMRYDMKDGIDDLQKAMVYLKKLIEIEVKK